MGLVEKKSKLNGSSFKKGPAGSQYVICVKNEGYPASLELRKIYRLLRDKTANKAGMMRVVDESGEDYLYPEEYFLAIKLSPSIARAVHLAS